MLQRSQPNTLPHESLAHNLPKLNSLNKLSSVSLRLLSESLSKKKKSYVNSLRSRSFGKHDKAHHVALPHSFSTEEDDKILEGDWQVAFVNLSSSPGCHYDEETKTSEFTGMLSDPSEGLNVNESLACDI